MDLTIICCDDNMLLSEHDQISPVTTVHVNDTGTFYSFFSNCRETVGMVGKKNYNYWSCTAFLLYSSFVPYSLAGYWRSCLERETMDGYDCYREYECKRQPRACRLWIFVNYCLFSMDSRSTDA